MSQPPDTHGQASSMRGLYRQVKNSCSVTRYFLDVYQHNLDKL